MPILVIILGVIFGAAFVAAFVWFGQKVTLDARKPQDKLITLFILLECAMVAVWVVDKVVSVRTNLLTENENSLLFAFIKDTGLMLFAFYFGKQQKDEP